MMEATLNDNERSGDMDDDDKGLTDKVMDEGRSIFGKGTTIAKGAGKDGPTELFVVSFPGASKADEVLDTLRQLNDQRLLALGDAAVVRCRSDGGLLS